MKKFCGAFVIMAAVIACLCMNVYAMYEVTYTAQEYVSGSVNKTLSNGGVSLGTNNNVGYAVNFDQFPSEVKLRLGTDKTNSGYIELRLDSSAGPLLGTISTETAGSSWKTEYYSTPLKSAMPGEHTIWVCAKKGVHDFTTITFTVPDKEDRYARFTESDLFSDIADSSMRTEINLLAELGILESDGASPFDGERLITKRDLVRALAGFFEDTISSKKTALFADLPADDPDFDAFGKLCSVGVLEADIDKRIYPDSSVKLTDACELACLVLNYGDLHKMGEDYFSLAAKAGVTKGVKNSGSLKRYDMAVILNNMLSADYLEYDSVSRYGVRFREGKNILEKNRDIYKATGVVSANGSNNLYSTDRNSRLLGTVEIDGITYLAANTYAENYLGFLCTFYYEYDVDSDTGTLVAIRPEEGVSYEKLSSRDVEFVEISDDVISYYDEKGRIAEYDLNTKTVVMYNGRPADSSIESMVEVTENGAPVQNAEFQGDILLIDNDDDGVFDVVMIEQSETVLFGGIGSTTLHDMLRDRNISFDDIDDVRIFSGESACSWNSLEIGSVLEYYKSKNSGGDVLHRFYLIDQTAEGLVIAADNGGERVTLDDGSEYERYYACHKEVPLNDMAELKLNGYGFFVDITNAKVQVGIVVESGMLGGGLSKNFAVKLLMESNEIKTVEMNPKAYVDGVWAKNLDTIYNGNSSFTGLSSLPADSPIRYKLNTDGKIVMVDTVNPGAGGANDALTCIKEKGYTYYRSSCLENESQQAVCPVATDAKFVNVGTEGNEDLYGFSAKLAWNNSRRTIAAYSTKEDSMVADLLISWVKYFGSSFNNYFVFEGKTYVLGEDGEQSIKLKGYGNTGPFEAIVNPNVYDLYPDFKAAVDSLEPGDLAQINTDAEGKLIKLEMRYFHDGAEQNAAGVSSTLSNSVYQMSHSDDVGRMYRGMVTKREGNFAQIQKYSGADAAYEYLDSSCRIIVCEEGSRYTITDNAASIYIAPGSNVVVCVAPYQIQPCLAVVYK